MNDRLEKVIAYDENGIVDKLEYIRIPKDMAIALVQLHELGKQADVKNILLHYLYYYATTKSIKIPKHLEATCIQNIAKIDQILYGIYTGGRRKDREVSDLSGQTLDNPTTSPTTSPQADSAIYNHNSINSYINNPKQESITYRGAVKNDAPQLASSGERSECFLENLRQKMHLKFGEKATSEDIDDAVDIIFLRVKDRGGWERIKHPEAYVHESLKGWFSTPS